MSNRHKYRVLNVGGNNRTIPLPDQYNGWQQYLLDIDPKGGPDIVCDSRDLCSLPGSEYDAVYCSHNLEHYYRHDVLKVLQGFTHVLKEYGFAHIRVPDIGAIMQIVVERNMDISDVLYSSQAGPIKVRDVIYGLESEIEQSGNDYFAHKTGFSQKSLREILAISGFNYVFVSAGNYEINALAFIQKPDDFTGKLFNLPLD